MWFGKVTYMSIHIVLAWYWENSTEISGYMFAAHVVIEPLFIHKSNPHPSFNLTSLLCSRFLRYKTVWTWSCPVEKIFSSPVRHLHGVLQPGHSYWAWCWGRGGQSGHITTHLKSNVWSDEIKSISTALRCSYGTSGLRKIPSNPTFSSLPLNTCQN